MLECQSFSLFPKHCQEKKYLKMEQEINHKVIFFSYLCIWLSTIPSHDLSPRQPGCPLQNDCCLPLREQPRRGWSWGQDSRDQGVRGSRHHWEHLSCWVKCRLCWRFDWRHSCGHCWPKVQPLEPPGQFRHQHRRRGSHHPPPHSSGKAEPRYVPGWKVGVMWSSSNHVYQDWLYFYPLFDFTGMWKSYYVSKTVMYHKKYSVFHFLLCLFNKWSNWQTFIWLDF